MNFHNDTCGKELKRTYLIELTFSSFPLSSAYRYTQARHSVRDCRTNRQDSRFAFTRRAMYKDVHCESSLHGRVLARHPWHWIPASRRV
ncbi:MAG: hypothetical protein PHD43_07475 [Methylococcales bacterium]|nr:hypothetical protein [Methylococcales bacterium]